MVSWKDLYPTYGDFTDFTDNVIGSYGFVGELFVTASETYRQPPKPGAAAAAPIDDEDMMMNGGIEQERERLKFSDNVAQGELHRPWKPFKHPQFGDIEIGGWVKMSTRLPHPFMLTDLTHRNASAVMFAASQTPDISLEVLPPVKAGGDLYKLRVRVVNGGSIPSLTLQRGAAEAAPAGHAQDHRQGREGRLGRPASAAARSKRCATKASGPTCSSSRCPATARWSSSSSCRARAR